jgi:ABC-type transport system involved in multi-copper enzyme maturation permease subunit
VVISLLEGHLMGDSLHRAATPELLHYRPWRGDFRSPAASVWPIARVALVSLFRRWMFWIIYVLGLLIFLLFFFGQYLLSWAQTQAGEAEVQVGGLGRMNPRHLIQIFRVLLKLDGGAETYRTFFAYQGYIVMIVLALAGSLLIGNDLRFGSLPYYLSKPLSRWHYLLGKGLAVAAVINLMTTVPAVILFVQWGVMESWDYFYESFGLFLGILGYGLVLTLTLTLLILATATWLRRTVPLIMTWTALFFFCRLLATALVDGLHFSPRWRLIDLWNSMSLIGKVCLNIRARPGRPVMQPSWHEAALVLGGVSLLCLTYLIRRIRAVEIVK